MKFIALADLHLSLYSQDKVISESSLPERLHTLNFVLRDVAEYGIKNNIRIMTIAGDIFHTKSLIHALAQSVLLDFIKDYTNTFIFYVIDGNHDLSSRSGSGVSALKCLDFASKVNMIHETRQVENILFVPWGPNLIDDVQRGNADYLVSHFGLNEAQLSSGISIVSEVRLRDLKQYKKCILGHYHKPQEVGNVIYVGSPIQLDWGEKHEEKRFLIVDTDNHTIDSIPTHGYKKYHQFIIDEDNKDEMIEVARAAQSKGDNVTIVKESGVDLDTIASEFQIIDKTEVDITNRGITTNMSQHDRLQRYMEIKEIPKEDMQAYENVAIEIIEECNET